MNNNDSSPLLISEQICSLHSWLHLHALILYHGWFWGNVENLEYEMTHKWGLTTETIIQLQFGHESKHMTKIIAFFLTDLNLIAKTDSVKEVLVLHMPSWSCLVSISIPKYSIWESVQRYRLRASLTHPNTSARTGKRPPPHSPFEGSSIEVTRPHPCFLKEISYINSTPSPTHICWIYSCTCIN